MPGEVGTAKCPLPYDLRIGVGCAFVSLGKLNTVKKLVSLLMFAALVGGLNVVIAESASASNTVTVKKIASKTARYKHKATIKPNVAHHGNISNVHQTLTVKKGKRTVGKNRKSIALKAGTYSVKTTVKYRTYKWVNRKTTKDVLTYEAYDDVPVRCEIENVSSPEDTTSGYESLCTGNFTGSLMESGDAGVTGGDANRWKLDGSGDSPNYVEAGATADSLIGNAYSISVKTYDDLFRAETVSKRVKSYSGTKTRTRTQKLTIRQRERPGSTSPDGWDCPSWAPIKGNAGSHIYHMPSGAFYDRTNAEICFSSEGAARDAGYRKAKR